MFFETRVEFERDLVRLSIFKNLRCVNVFEGAWTEVMEAMTHWLSTSEAGVILAINAK